MPTLTPITGTLNPGIVRVVEWLRAHGFDTTDSGDGATHDHPCDRPYPYVSMRGTESDARRLAALLRARGVVLPASAEAWPLGCEAPRGVVVSYSYDPASDIGIVDLAGLCDRTLPSRALTLPARIAALGDPIEVRYARDGELPDDAFGSTQGVEGGALMLVRPGQLPAQEAVVLIHEALHFVEEHIPEGPALSEAWVTDAAYGIAAILAHAGALRGVGPGEWRDAFGDAPGTEDGVRGDAPDAAHAPAPR